LNRLHSDSLALDIKKKRVRSAHDDNGLTSKVKKKMARFLKGINGAYSGKVGSVIGSRWRSVDYVRSLSRPSNKSASDLQVAQRARFRLAIAFLSPIKDLLNLGYSDKLEGRATGYNKAVQHVINHAIVGDYPDYELNYAAVQIAKGGLSNLLAVQWEQSAPQEITITWDTSTNRFNAFSDDTVILLTYNTNKSFFSILESGERKDGSLVINLPAAYAGDHLVGWVFTGHRNGVKTSMSYYLGEILLN